MSLIAVLAFGFAAMFTIAVADYFSYEDMIFVNELWAYQNPNHLQIKPFVSIVNNCLMLC